MRSSRSAPARSLRTRYGGAEHIVTQRLADLFERSGAGVAGVERVLDRLEQDTGDRATADYLRVVLSLSRLNSRGYFYRGNPIQLSDEERTARIERTTRLLDALSRGESRYTRWALATLATFYFEQLDFSRARVRYQEYVARFGASDYAWLAALRIGECAEGSGDLAGAVDAYRAASARRDAGALPMAIGHVAAARVFESQARLDLALAEYRRALASWDNDYGREYRLSTNLTAVGISRRCAQPATQFHAARTETAGPAADGCGRESAGRSAGTRQLAPRTAALGRRTDRVRAGLVAVSGQCPGCRRPVWGTYRPTAAGAGSGEGLVA